MPRPLQTPKARVVMLRGRKMAVVTLSDRETGKRRNVWLGPWGADATRARERRVVDEWEASGRRLSGITRASVRKPTGLTVTILAYEYIRHVQANASRSTFHKAASMVRAFRGMYGDKVATEIGPNALREFRETMLTASAAEGHKPRKAWARSTANQVARAVVTMFRWGTSRELVPESVWQRLSTLEPLKPGQHGARETDPIGPVDARDVRAACKHLAAPVRAMIELQLATGMRPGEVVRIRPCDIDTRGKVWTWTPERHKTAHRGKRRTVYFGPKARAVLTRSMRGRPTDAPCFSPAEGAAERRKLRAALRAAPDTSPREPVAEPKRRPGAAYTPSSYRRAVWRACERAGIDRWSPNQLRHSFATRVRAAHGLEAAAVLLGHSSAVLTDAVYAQRDEEKARAVAAAAG